MTIEISGEAQMNDSSGTGEEMPRRTRDDIQVVGRVAALLEQLSPQRRSIDAQLAAEMLGVGRSTAHRYLASMEKAGLLQREAGGYAAGPLVVRLGALVYGGPGIIEASGPVLHRLAHEIRGTIVLSVWGGDAPVVARVISDPTRRTTVAIDVGSTLGPEAAQSLVFDAYRGGELDDPALFRYSAPESTGPQSVWVCRRVYTRGAVKAIAVPVFDFDGEVVATLAVLGFAVDLPDEKDDDATAHLIAGAKELQTL